METTDIIPSITETATPVVDNTSLQDITDKLSELNNLMTTANDLLEKLLNKFMVFMDYIGVVSAITLFILFALFVMLAVKRR